jgi:hypothetical protein
VLLITDDMRRIPATLCDVSSLGMRLEIAEELPLGLTLRVDVHGAGASGIVRHCIVRNDKYEVGVHLFSSRADLAASMLGTRGGVP